MLNFKSVGNGFIRNSYLQVFIVAFSFVGQNLKKNVNPHPYAGQLKRANERGAYERRSNVWLISDLKVIGLQKNT